MKMIIVNIRKIANDLCFWLVKYGQYLWSLLALSAMSFNTCWIKTKRFDPWILGSGCKKELIENNMILVKLKEM
jgi:hypothetical protein